MNYVVDEYYIGDGRNRNEEENEGWGVAREIGFVQRDYDYHVR